LLTRYRYSGSEFSETRFTTRLAEAANRGFASLVFNEARFPLATMRWLYPGEPGPLFELAR
jgi:hypothetical protein